MSTTHFRPATTDDLPQIVAMLADDALGREREDASVPLLPAYIEAFAAISADPNELLAVAESDGELVGCLQLSFLPGISHKGAWRGQIEGVRIAAVRRGTGLGREMISWAIERCRERGCRIVQLTTNASRTDARRFYESLGFEATHVGMKITL
ncbi:GNAT family N-acetyltransferase [Lutibaculum baratangense]|uniref:Putative acetyltransferase n=1 Tax=Lutibaculum baratangense AMV1 TaxID=631454 RepID=V4TK30_9HYPH|nr:GNAT family N-acetyltransferase [Lutibaculum baratangense]ESR26248.1 putative acetyltransferase [Lutibaculum baratangense AMV1]